jgi:hypothetical protein
MNDNDLADVHTIINSYKFLIDRQYGLKQMSFNEHHQELLLIGSAKQKLTRVEERLNGGSMLEK